MPIRPGYTVIPGDWTHLERVINELSYYYLAAQSQSISANVSGLTLVSQANLATESELDLVSEAESQAESRILVLESEVSELQSVALTGYYDSEYSLLMVSQGV